MKVRNTLAIIFTLLTAIVAVFAWPAANIEVLGQTIDWDGLNLSTVTGKRYEGELQFEESLDLRGGKKYTYSAELMQTPDQEIGEAAEAEEGEKGKQEAAAEQPDYQSLAEDNVNKFINRLQHYGYQDFKLKWYLENESTLKVELDISKHQKEDEQVLQLLASRGSVQLWTQDPEYDPEAADPEAQQSFNFYDGMQQIEIEQNQILEIDSTYNNKARGYGFKIRFDAEALVPLLMATQTETYRATMLVIDGQPIATRTYQIENIEKDDAEPIMYMSSLVGDDFAVNDAVEAVFRSGEVDTQLNLQSVEEVKPTLGEDYLDNTKLALLLMIGFLAILLIYRYNWLGIYQVIYLTSGLIWSLALMKFFDTKLSLALVAGILLGILFVLLINLMFVRRLDTAEKLKSLLENVRSVRDNYRNVYFLALTLVFIGSFIGAYFADQMLGAFGAVVIVSLTQLYIFTEIFLPQFVHMQTKL
ncbi:hypothetical protein GF389_00780 [Candidatus Dojkabacteria bacterium]|nr:hypothetical protein [Candidatus Dojkabacteria bacterium]